MVGFGQSVLDAAGDADAIENVRPEEASTGVVAVPGQIGEGHAIVGEDGVDLVGEELDHGLEEGGAFHLPGTVVELDIGDFVTRSMARNMTSLPSAWRSSQLSMWT